MAGSSRYTAILDANVLYPQLLRDTLLSLAVAQAANGNIVESRARFQQLQRVDAALWNGARQRFNGTHGEDAGIDPRLLFLIRQEAHLQACSWRQWEPYGDIFRDFLRAPGDGDEGAVGIDLRDPDGRRLLTDLVRDT